MMDEIQCDCEICYTKAITPTQHGRSETNEISLIVPVPAEIGKKLSLHNSTAKCNNETRVVRRERKKKRDKSNSKKKLNLHSRPRKEN